MFFLNPISSFLCPSDDPPRRFPGFDPYTPISRRPTTTGKSTRTNNAGRPRRQSVIGRTSNWSSRRPTSGASGRGGGGMQNDLAHVETFVRTLFDGRHLPSAAELLGRLDTEIGPRGRHYLYE